MAKPTIANAAWGTDTNFTGGPANGTAVKVSASSGVKAQGWRPGDTLGFVGAWFNYWMNQAYLWFQYLDTLNTDAGFLGLTFVWTALHRFTAGLRAAGIGLESGDLVYTDSSGAAALRGRNKMLPLVIVPANGTVGQWQIATAGNAYSSAAADGVAYIELPTGAILTDVSVGVRDSAAQTVTMWVEKEDINTSSGVITLTALGGSSHVSNGSGTQQSLIATGFNETVANAGRRYRIYLRASAINLTISHILVSFSDAGFTGNA